MDQWRLYQLSKWLSSQKHDYSKFGTGSRETLWPASGAARLREELLAFHSRWYSANLMGLCVLGSESLDRLTQLVVDLFAPVRNLNAPVREWRDHPLTDEHLKARDAHVFLEFKCMSFQSSCIPFYTSSCHLLSLTSLKV